MRVIYEFSYMKSLGVVAYIYQLGASRRHEQR